MMSKILISNKSSSMINTVYPIISHIKLEHKSSSLVLAESISMTISQMPSNKSTKNKLNKKISGK